METTVIRFKDGRKEAFRVRYIDLFMLVNKENQDFIMLKHPVGESSCVINRHTISTFWEGKQ